MSFTAMKIIHFHDTDTLYIELADSEVVETRDLNENTLIDLDQYGNLVAIALEHASKFVTVSDFSFQHITSPSKPAEVEASLR